MQNAITINNTSLEVKEYKGKRVVTFRDIDMVHQRVEGTAGRNFRANKKHFIENEDYYKIQPDEIRLVGIKSPNGGIVVTESGYLMLVKSFTDDLAWTVQRQLVNTYFKQRLTLQHKAEEITPKYHNGEPVITIQDIVRLSGLNANTIRYYIKRLERNRDYYLLESEALKKFKRNNPSIDRMISSLCVINRRGAEKLAQMMKCVPIPDFFKALPTNELKWSKKLYVDIPDNNDAQKLINNIRRKATTLTELMAQVDMYVAEDEYQAVVKVIDRLGVSILVCCNDFRRIKYKLSEKYA